MNIRNVPIRYVTLPYDVTFDYNLYSADNTLAAIDPPKLSGNADREAFKVSFADPEMVMSGLCDEMINARITIRGGFFNTTGDNLISSGNAIVEPNKPLLEKNDTLVIYKGFIDTVSYRMSESDGVLLDLECASPVASLDALNSFYTTRNSLRQRIPASTWASGADTAFDNISLGGKAQEILWGKI